MSAQYLTLGFAALFDDPERPVFPRWFAFFNFWSAPLLIPAGMITFFKTGAFAWSGLLGFYLGVVVFTLWCLVTFWLLMLAIKKQDREHPVKQPRRGHDGQMSHDRSIHYYSKHRLKEAG